MDIGIVIEAMDTLRIAITIFDMHERLVYANRHLNYLFRSLPPYEALLGETYERLVRREVGGGEIAAEHLAQGTEHFVQMRRAQLQPGRYQPMDITLADGRIMEIKMRSIPSGGWIGLWSDVTEARHALLRLEDTISLSADAFAFYDRHDHLIACNHVYASLVGNVDMASLRGKSFTEVIGLAAQNELYELEDEQAFVKMRLEMRRQAAAAYTLTTKAGAAYLVRDRATRDGGRATVFTDTTDKHRISSALSEQTHTLQDTRAALEELEKETRQQADYLATLTRQLGAAQAEAGTAKTALLRTMSHELKTPLNAVIGFSDLMRMGAHNLQPAQIVDYANIIHMAGHNLLRLLNQILDLTRIAAGRYDLYREILDADAILHDIVEAQQSKAEARSIKLQGDVAKSGLRVYADENALRLMLTQLTENALSFTQQGGDVVLSAEMQDSMICFAVRDNGPGVAEKDLERILEPFEQVGRGTSDHSGGAGLGLTLVKGMADLQGGALRLESAAGAGFTAYLELPKA